jgi:hypothetical protein
MKKIALLMMMGMASLVWGSEDVTVQVISAVHEKSITPAFDVKLKKTGLDVHKKIEKGRYVVMLGTYKDHKSAEHALAKARLVVTKDAFIRPVNRDSTAVAHANVIQPKAAENKTVAVEQKAAVVEQKTVAATAEVPKAAIAAVQPAAQEVKQPISVVPAAAECDKKEMRKDDFAQAIHYYKISPYHRFEPVVLRQ